MSALDIQSKISEAGVWVWGGWVLCGHTVLCIVPLAISQTHQGAAFSFVFSVFCFSAF
jgi:hypothetical protein